MLICVALVLIGAFMVYVPLAGRDCNACFRMEREDLRTARCGLVLVVVGCGLVCYQFWYWG